MRYIRGLLDRIVLVASIIGAGCIPSFIAQYRQRLGGRLDQVLKDIEPFQKIADQYHHGNLSELIDHHVSSADATFQSEGAALQAMIDAAEHLRRALKALNTDLFHQVTYLLTGGLDREIARAAWEIYAPSFNLSTESVIFAATAGIIIWLLFLAIWLAVARLLKMLAAK